ncbi:MAG TPA: ATP-binding cassette domain-containing protein [bacterium]|nr:ATP-binding cassette domain-containing protein [bacterium]
MKPIAILDNLSFTYSEAVEPALTEVNLTIYSGQFLAITGPSGCGKSTLALCLAGFIPHAYPGEMNGAIRIQGKDSRDYPNGGLSGIVGLVQQDPEAQLCTLTVEDEVAFGPENLCLPPAQIRERVQQALFAVGAENLLGRKVHTLSGGEKQRIAIASVLALSPLLLILDEPTANLDPASTKEVLETLDQLRQQSRASIVVIEHRLQRLAGIADELIQMDKGKIISRGNLEQLQQRYLPAPSIRKPAPEPGAKAMPKIVRGNKAPFLTVDSLSVGYEGTTVLSGVSFSAYPGETVALMGDNGSGKTTLLLALLGLLPLRNGSIHIGGKDITKTKAARRARKLGLVFQNPNHQLFENTVLKEALLPSSFLSRETPEQTESRLQKLLVDFELESYQHVNPFCLSFGEKRRLTLVSVLAYTPPILILDEPIVGQDSRRLDFLLTALDKHQARGGITFFVCHEPEVVASCCQRVLFLGEGKLLIDARVEAAWRQLAWLGRNEYIPRLAF